MIQDVRSLCHRSHFRSVALKTCQPHSTNQGTFQSMQPPDRSTSTASIYIPEPTGYISIAPASPVCIYMPISGHDVQLSLLRLQPQLPWLRCGAFFPSSAHSTFLPPSKENRQRKYLPLHLMAKNRSRVRQRADSSKTTHSLLPRVCGFWEGRSDDGQSIEKHKKN